MIWSGISRSSAIPRAASATEPRPRRRTKRRGEARALAGIRRRRRTLPVHRPVSGSPASRRSRRRGRRAAPCARSPAPAPEESVADLAGGVRSFASISTRRAALERDRRRRAQSSASASQQAVPVPWRRKRRIGRRNPQPAFGQGLEGPLSAERREAARTATATGREPTMSASAAPPLSLAGGDGADAVERSAGRYWRRRAGPGNDRHSRRATRSRWRSPRGDARGEQGFAPQRIAQSMAS